MNGTELKTIADSKRTLWYVEFRCFGADDYSVPLMYMPVQRTYARGDSEEDAKAEVIGWAGPGYVKFLTVERAPEWMQ